MIKINRSKLEQIVLNKIRAERDQKLSDLDRQYMISLESGIDTEDIVKMKNELRDVTDKDFSKLSIEELANTDLDSALSL